MVRRWIAIAMVLALVSGSALSLPAFWSRPVVGQKSSQVARHWLNCVFTASSALTGTGLSPHDVGDDFNPRGQMLIFGLMQAGGLAVLIAGSLVGWRFRRHIGWGDGGEEPPRQTMWRPVMVVCAAALLIELAGAMALYYSDPRDGGRPADRLFDAFFLAVSAFCNNGLTLTRDSLIGRRFEWAPYGVILPLMVLGGLGGPVLCDLCRRVIGRVGGRPLSREARITLWATGTLLAAGGGLLFFIESTPRWQLRNPREDTPGRINIDAPPVPQEMIVFSSEDSAGAKSQRLRTMEPSRRAAAALFLSESARVGGLRVARLDEQSLSPAGRVLMMAWMLIGGGLGGTAGGLRIVVVVLLLGAAFRGRPASESERLHALKAASSAAAAFLLLIAGTTLVLVYRETGTPEECVFEAMSACCNSGLSTGFTRRLSVEGQVVTILAMLLGRIIPLAVLARETRAASVQARLSVASATLRSENSAS